VFRVTKTFTTPFLILPLSPIKCLLVPVVVLGSQSLPLINECKGR
jgi:hypothetical protein